MPEELPWELMRDSMSSFAHDSIAPFQFFVMRLGRIHNQYSEPELLHLKHELLSAANSLKAVHKQFTWLRSKKTSHSEKQLAESLRQYRRLVRARSEKVHSVFRQINKFYIAHKGGMGEEAKKLFDVMLERIGKYEKQFPANQLGRSMEVLLENQDLREFMKKNFKGTEFVDREGRPVQVVLQIDKRVRTATFDRELLYRSVYNLVTDAYNHTPGRPVHVTVKRKDGHIAINVTNKGNRLTPEELSKIGRVRFTQAMHDPARGYGKISTRLLTEAQGGTFRAGNSRIGPMLSIRLPLRRAMA
jgi:signal transduction histidine kinase